MKEKMSKELDIMSDDKIKIDITERQKDLILNSLESANNNVQRTKK